MEQVKNCQDALLAEKRAEELLASMTLTEKIGQLSQFGVSIYSNEEHFFEDHYPEAKIGSYLTVRGAAKTNRLQKNIIEQSRLSIPLLFADDVIHGYKTTFPTPLALSCSWEPDLARESAAAAAKEAYRAGLKWTFAPMVDIARDPRWGRIMEGYGEDPVLCSAFARQAVRGFQGDYIGQKDHLLACMKHYVGYGACIGGRDYNSADMSPQTLHDVYLPPFQAGIEEGAATVMTAFHDLNGVPCTANRYLLQDVLRQEFQFGGVVISDAGSIHELVNHGYCDDGEEAAGAAFSAGVDVVMAGDLYNDFLPSQLEKGVITPEQIDDAVKRILKLKILLGLFEEPFVDEEGESCFFAPEQLEIARNCAKRSVVLLENKNGVLPIQESVKRIAVVGPLANDREHVLGGWAGLAEPKHTVSVYDGIREAAGDRISVVTAPGCSIRENDTSGFAEAVKIAKEADLIVAVIGEGRDQSGEACSRSDLSIPGVQEQLVDCLLELGKPVVVLVSSGRPVLLSSLKEKANALLMIWQLGTETGHGVADILFGKYNPSGRLTTSFPYSVGQIPVYYNYFNTGRPALDVVAWEAKYRDCPIPPVYPFGYGKSYTEFVYTDLILSASEMTPDGSLTVCCTVTNKGPYDGEEVVQLYVRDRKGSRVRPVRELKDFRKVWISKGQSVSVSFSLQASQLAFYNPNMEKAVEPGLFTVWIGKDSSDTTLEGSFRVTDS